MKQPLIDGNFKQLESHINAIDSAQQPSFPHPLPVSLFGKFIFGLVTIITVIHFQ